MKQTTKVPDLTGLKPKKILLCQQRQIGDVVLATPAVRILKRQYPEAEIHFLTEKKCAPVLLHNPQIAKVWVIDKSVSFISRMKFLFGIRQERYDLVVDFQQLPRCKSAVLFSGAPVRLTYTPKWYNRFIYTHWSDMLGGYAVKAKMSVLRPLGFQWAGERPEIIISDAERKFAENYIAENEIQDDDIIITVDATHWSDTRRWLADYYAELIDNLIDRQANLKFILLYGPGEKDQAQKVYDAVENKKSCILPDDQLDIRMTVALMEFSWLHLGNCSAPKHIALAVKTPTFSIIGSNSGRSWTFPAADHNYATLLVDCARCQRNTCENGTLKCLKEFYPEIVLPLIADNLPSEPK